MIVFPKEIALDIETIPRKLTKLEKEFLIEKLEKHYTEKEPPKNYKSEQAIQKWQENVWNERDDKILEIQKGIIKEHALDPYYNQIISIAIAWYTGEKIETKTWYIDSGKFENNEIWEYIINADSIITFTNFDELSIRAYCYLNQLNLGDVRFIDISKQLGYRDKFGKLQLKSLKEYSVILLGEKYDSLAEDIYDLYKQSKKDEILEYNIKDAIATLKLYYLINKRVKLK